jgi:4-hydroxy 2-oxovalerate aldolase
MISNGGWMLKLRGDGDPRPWVLDVTIRDGGYLNDWQFAAEHIDMAISLAARADADIIEVGYFDDEPGLPEGAACPPAMLRRLRPLAGEALLAAMIRPSVKNPNEVLGARQGLVELLRIPVDVRRPQLAVELARRCLSHGFAVSFNFTSVSCFRPEQLAAATAAVAGLASAIYLADSRGALQVADIAPAVIAVRSAWDGPIGYHAHDNLGLAIATTEAALAAGCEMIDGSIAGAGIGGRNLRLDDALRIAMRTRADLAPAPDALAAGEAAIGVPPPGAEMPLYRVAGERNIRQEWVEPLMRQLGPAGALAFIEKLPRRTDWFEFGELDAFFEQAGELVRA